MELLVEAGAGGGRGEHLNCFGMRFLRVEAGIPCLAPGGMAEITV